MNLYVNIIDIKLKYNCNDNWHEFESLKSKNVKTIGIKLQFYKDTFWFPSPKMKRIKAQRAQYNESVKSGLGTRFQ